MFTPITVSVSIGVIIEVAVFGILDAKLKLMSNTFPDVSAKQLFGADAWALQKTISDATDHAKSVLISGEFVRKKRNEGNMNSSLGSTAGGALYAAKDIASRLSLDGPYKIAENSNHAFFGENLRRAIGSLKVLVRK